MAALTAGALNAVVSAAVPATGQLQPQHERHADSPRMHAASSSATRVTCVLRANQQQRSAVHPVSFLSSAKKVHGRRRYSAAASAQAVSEESPEPAAAPAEEPATSAEASDSESADGASAGALPGFNLLEAAREAFTSQDPVLVSEVEAQLSALEADRDGLAARVSELTAELSGSKDRFLRLNADFDNFRKRSEREKGELAARVKSEVMESLLPMVDSFERAKLAVKVETEGEQKIDGAYQGIYKQFVEVMRGLGVSAVETVGTEFNPQIHDAIMREESTEFPEGIVIEEFRKGFVIGDRLVRPAMVKVSAGPGPSAPGSDSGAESASESDGEATVEQGLESS